MSQGNFECNICLEAASEPVVTRCGHLYCWNCLVKWLENKNDCPVCKGGVVKEECIPLYGRGRAAPRSQGTTPAAPPRPRAERQEPPPFVPNQGGIDQRPWPLIGGFFFFSPSMCWVIPLLMLYRFFIHPYVGSPVSKGTSAIVFGLMVLYALLFMDVSKI